MGFYITPGCPSEHQEEQVAYARAALAFCQEKHYAEFECFYNFIASMQAVVVKNRNPPMAVIANFMDSRSPMNKTLVCILFLLAPLFCRAQHYPGCASSFYNNGSDDFIISSSVEDSYRTYRIRNISDERYTLYLFTKTRSGIWVLVGSATLDPGRKSPRLIQKGGTDKTLVFYYLSGRREKMPTTEEVNKIESSY
ncbi:MAG: hypothetical protein ACHQD8_01870 [Chitinophagales bacterium]